MKIKQTLNYNGTASLEYSIDGTVKSSTIVTVSKEWSNVKVYAGDKWYDPADASIRNLKVIHNKAPKTGK